MDQVIQEGGVESNYERNRLILCQLRRYDAAIEKEFSLVGDRMTWMVISEAFIFTAFTVAAVAPREAMGGRPAVVAILIAMFSLGCFLAGIVIPAIAAAHHAIERLKDARDQVETKLPEWLRARHISVHDREHNRGNIPPMWVPLFILVVWIALAFSITYWFPRS
jgi:hypothetical protein